MKKFVLLFTIIALISSLNSCTTDNGSEIEVEKEGLFKNKNINDFLDNYYNIDYSIGETVISETNDVKITSLVSNVQDSPNGYVFVDLSTNKFLYFVDLNFDLNEVTSFDFIKDESFKSFDFFVNNEIDKDKGFDLITEIQSNNLLQEKIPFWGTSCGEVWYIGDQAFQTCCHYVFWIQNGCQINQL